MKRLSNIINNVLGIVDSVSSSVGDYIQNQSLKWAYQNTKSFLSEEYNLTL
jgi:hypothetical protein